nr:hypothetical protein GCM10020185_05230 [Pseudomonas brassicacearum subsp. brassicacearum]
MLDDVLNQFADFGLEPAQPLIYGKLTRCKTTLDKGKEKKTAGTFYTNTIPRRAKL